ncbi:MAG: zinc ribbon domain-containing protein [Muribaculaceae bacterium]|nr:zinc ribbon domain-containing protein [Muribaculaceae bacterium]
MDNHDRRYQEKEKFREKRQTRREHDDVPDYICPFCGAELDPDDMCCTECGGPRSGITCPRCGTLNFGSFCSHCNEPLDDLAQEAVRQAKNDPHFKEAERLAGELAELDRIIADISGSDGAGATSAGEEPKKLDTSSHLSDADREALARYNTLFAGIGDIKVKPAAPEKKHDKPKEAAEQKQGFSVNAMSLNEAVKKYKEVAEKLQEELNAMLPDPKATPQEQRNFFSARKISSAELISVRQCWVCNYCGCHHNQPSECYKPWMGGKWIMDTELGNLTTTTLYD